ncbi:hypothetical protein YC2023_108264 [Brassica napus]
MASHSNSTTLTTTSSLRPCDPSSYHESSEQWAKLASTFYLINASLPKVRDICGCPSVHISER